MPTFQKGERKVLNIITFEMISWFLAVLRHYRQKGESESREPTKMKCFLFLIVTTVNLNITFSSHLILYSKKLWIPPKSLDSNGPYPNV